MTQQDDHTRNTGRDGADGGAGDRRDDDMPAFLVDREPLDNFLFAALLLMGLYSMAMIGLRAYLLSHPLAYTLLIGGYTSATVAGANVSAGNGTAWLYLACTLVGALKFMPIYWLMGRRWGREFIDASLRYMPRVHRFFNRAVKDESTRTKAVVLGLLPLGFAPGPVPALLLNAMAGLLRIGFLLTLAVNVASVALVNGIFMYLGYVYGEQVLDIVDLVNRYLLWITVALIGFAVLSSRRKRVA